MRDIEPFGNNHYEMKWCKGIPLSRLSMTAWYMNYSCVKPSYFANKETKVHGCNFKLRRMERDLGKLMSLEKKGVFAKCDRALPAN